METYSSNSFAIKGKTVRTWVYKNHLEMVKGCRIDTGLCKRHYQKGSSKNTWNKGKFPNWYRARWAKGKTGIGLDEHGATHT